jgi:hypothetical protein
VHDAVVDPEQGLVECLAFAGSRCPFPTRGDPAVVVDDREAAGRPLVVERGERIHRRFVQVAVKAQHGEALDRFAGQRVARPALPEDRLVEESGPGDRGAHRLERDRKRVEAVELAPGILPVASGVGCG